FRALRYTSGSILPPASAGWRVFLPNSGVPRVALHLRLYSAARIRGLTCSDAVFLGFRALRYTPRLHPAARIRGLACSDAVFLGFRALRYTPGFILPPASAG